MIHIRSFLKHFLIVITILSLWVFYILANSYDTLVEIRDIDTEYYVIDGWMNDDELEKAYDLIKDREFKAIYTLGLYNGYNPTFDITNYGDFARNRLLYNHPELDPNIIQTVQFDTKTNRTYTGVTKLKDRLIKDGVKSITLVTLDVHTKKSMHIYDLVFKDSGIEIGSLGAKILDKDDWYKNSYDFMKVTSELLSLALTKLKY